MEKTIAFFDFDGTITRKDSMIEFLKFTFGRAGFYKSLFFLSPWLGGMKLGIVSNTYAKEKMLAYFFKGMPLDTFNALCKNFAAERLPSLMRPDALEAILEHQKQGHEVVVVSASAENWISDWCNTMNLKYLATRLMTDSNGRITGKLNGANCNGEEKVKRIMLSYDTAGYTTIYGYGDTKGDASMLKMATHPHYRHFKK